MSHQVQEAYIVAATRTPVGKAPKGSLRNTRPDDLLVARCAARWQPCPASIRKPIEDAIVGCAFPEAEQGMNMARMALLLCRPARRRSAA